MKKVDFLIIGGSAAGTTAAETIRNHKPDSSITIVTDENNEFYSRVLLRNYIRGEIKREQLFMRKGDWYERQKIGLIKGVRVQGLGVKEKKVKLSNGEEIQYGKLLISVGGKVITLKIPGSDSGSILYLRTVEDADQIIKISKKSKKAVVIGGGFIGLDFATCLQVNGVTDITFLVLEDYFWQEKLDKASSSILQKVMEEKGIKIVSNEEAIQISDAKGRHIISTKSGNKYEADVVGVGIGIRIDLSWMEASVIKLDKGIVTNEYLETSVEDIYAAGDCAQFEDVIFGRNHLMGNWANATSQGAAVGKIMAGDKTKFETASSYSMNVFQTPISFIGVTDSEYADEVIAQGSVEENKMIRIFVKKIKRVERVVGATIINSVSDIAPLTRAVKGKVDISKFKEKLSELGFDLNDLNS